MFKLPQRETKTLVAVHGWSGVVLGLLLYAVICTGVGAVFATDINRWANPLPHRPLPFHAPGLDAKVDELARGIDPKFHEHVSIYEGGGNRAHVLFYAHDTDADGDPAERGVDFELDPATWQVLERREGWFDDIFAEQKSSAVADFLINLHVRLHIPEPYGLLVTGVLGLVMMVAAVSGLLIHRHLIKDLFTLRRNRDRVLERRDLHAVAGSWNLPFAFILAFTGSFYSFAGTVGMPALAAVSFGGDLEAMEETLYGAARPANPAASSVASLETIVADARAAGITPSFVGVEHYGRADAAISVYAMPQSGRLVIPSRLYDGATGEFVREQPAIGQAPSAGAAIIGMMYPLHVGNFAGAVSKSVWVGLGFAGAYVTFTGLLLWVRRRQEQRLWRGFARVVYWLGYGLPLGLICAPLAYFLLPRSPAPGALQIQAFLGVLAIAGLAALVTRRLEDLRWRLLTAVALGLWCLPIARLMGGGPGWSDALQIGAPAVPAVDLALIVLGAACFWHIRRDVPRWSLASRAGELGTSS